MIIYIILMFILVCLGVFYLLKSRNMHIWIIPYLKQKAFNKKRKTDHAHIYFCLADHYEPYFANASQDKARKLVDEWVEKYRSIAKKYHDSDGNPPKHSYFYPIEEYDEYILTELEKICSEGLGDVDVHLHHDNDTEENLKSTLNKFKELLHQRHGLLRKNSNGEIVYGFIHGNWALDNSRPDGRWCGVNNEIQILLDTGCVFDMTMPSAPSDTQTKIINSIYFAKEDGKCKSHDQGELVEVGKWKDDSLCMIQGPLELNWKRRKAGIVPKIEAGELSADAPPAPDRATLWLNSSIHIKGKEEHVFIKLYTHGLQEKNMRMFFEQGGFEKLWGILTKNFMNERYSLHFVTAWEMYKTIKLLANDGRSE